MKIVKTVTKILVALAAVAGAVYVVATYGDKIVAWAKKMLASLPCPCCKDVELTEEAAAEATEETAEEAVAEEAVEEPAVEELAVEEPAAEEAVVAEEADFEA